MPTRIVNVNLWGQIWDLFHYGIQPNSLGELVTHSIDLIIIAAIIIALFFLIIGAVNWITSEGKPDKLEGARNTVIHAIVGLILAVAAYLIWILIVKQFLGIDIQNGINLSGPGSATTTVPGTGTGGGSGGSGSCTVGTPPVSDGGAGGYCNGGAAEVQCHGPDTHGSTTYSYPHFDPCRCITGTENTNYDFTSC